MAETGHLFLSLPHREAVETIARIHVGRDEESEELDTLRGDIVVQCENISVCRELEGAHFLLLHQHRLGHAVGAPAAVGGGLRGRDAQDRTGHVYRMYLLYVVFPGNGVRHQRTRRRRVRNGGSVLLRILPIRFLQPKQIFHPVDVFNVGFVAQRVARKRCQVYTLGEFLLFFRGKLLRRNRAETHYAQQNKKYLSKFHR